MLKVLALATSHLGFVGISGIPGLIVGLIVLAIVVWALFTIFDIVIAKFNRPETNWIFQIARVLLILLVVLWFVQLIFGTSIYY